ncbi:MAG: hypothetical protein R3D55_00745 [Chloroflexota bacterium]
MSTVPIVVVARHAGMKNHGRLSITNMAVPDPKPGTVLDHAEALETGKQIIPKLTALLRGILTTLIPRYNCQQVKSPGKYVRIRWRTTLCAPCLFVTLAKPS